MLIFDGTLNALPVFGGELLPLRTLDGDPAAVLSSRTPAYTGELTVTPSRETQTLETEGLRLLQNVTVLPIPQNYGLITTDGFAVTVS